MKKRIYVLLIIVLSLFVFSGRVEADEDKVMYLECEYDGESYVFAYVQSTTSTTSFGNFEYRVFKKESLGEVSECSSGSNGYGAACQGNSTSSSGYSIVHWVNDVNKFDACIENCKNVDNQYLYIGKQMTENISNGMCPVRIELRPGGMYLGGTTSKYVEKNVLNSQFVIYKAAAFQQNASSNYRGTNVYFEGYTADGTYLLLYKNLTTDTVEIVGTEYSLKAQHSALAASGSKYFDLMNSENRYGFGTISDVYLSSDKMSDYVDDWLSSGYADKLTNQVNASNELLNNSSKIINACSNLNETKEYNFESYSSTDMVNDLEVAYNTLSKFYSNSNNYRRCSNSEETDNYSESFLDCTLYNNLGYTNISNGKESNPTGEYINAIILNNFMDELSNSYPDIEKTKEIESYLDTLYRCSINLDSSSANLSGDDKEKIENLRSRFEDLANRQQLSVVEDCQSLIGSDLINKVKSYTNIIKIAIPIVLIIFGIFDFGKVIFTGNDDAMNKAKKDFFTRILVCVLIFLIPTIVELILTIANTVWKFISPSSCGLF